MCEASEVEGRDEREGLWRARDASRQKPGTGARAVSRQGGPEREDAMTQYHPLSSGCRHQSHFTARSINAIPIIFVIVISSYILNRQLSN